MGKESEYPVRIPQRASPPMADSPSRDDLQAFTAAAEAIALEARTLVRSRLACGFGHELKADGSFVTEIDIAVEDLIRSRIESAFPGHRIVGEERGESRGVADLEWVIDPIDGTHSLRHGVPLYGTLLALRHRGRPVLGLIDLPELDRTYVGAEGLGARCNRQTLHLRDVPDAGAIRHEIIGIGERKQFVKAGAEGVFDGLMRRHDSVRTYCDCFGHALAIEGSVGAMVDYNLSIWDVAATEAIMREVGGAYVRISRGVADESRADRYDVVFGKPTVVEWVLERIGRG